tara:strand:+ start:4636 stop:5106 length:471 start_codon:yes stop_codon:yes gene_type:complete
MTNFSFTPEDFRNWALEGFPISLMNPKLFIDSLKVYINDTSENMFSYIEGKSLIITGYDDTDASEKDVLQVHYNNLEKRVKMKPLCINESILDDDEEHTPSAVLSLAYLKVSMYCKTIVKLRKEAYSKNNPKIMNSRPQNVKTIESNNTKYEPWLL